VKIEFQLKTPFRNGFSGIFADKTFRTSI